MDDDGSYIVRMSFEGSDFLGSIVIIDPHLKVIGTAYDPVLPRDEAACSYGDIGQFECLDNGLQTISIQQNIVRAQDLLVSRTTIYRHGLGRGSIS